MEIIFATWTLRFAILAAVAVAGVSVSVGTPILDAVDRGLAAAAGFTLAGRWLVGYFEPPERRMLKARRRREELRAKRLKQTAGGRSASAAGKAA